jgi:hypothetical protein
MLTAAYAKAANERRDFLRHVGPDRAPSPTKRNKAPARSEPSRGLCRKDSKRLGELGGSPRTCFAILKVRRKSRQAYFCGRAPFIPEYLTTLSTETPWPSWRPSFASVLWKFYLRQLWTSPSFSTCERPLQSTVV